jgi:hypothetical protein
MPPQNVEDIFSEADPVADESVRLSMPREDTVMGVPGEALRVAPTPSTPVRRGSPWLYAAIFIVVVAIFVLVGGIWFILREVRQQDVGSREQGAGGREQKEVGAEQSTPVVTPPIAPFTSTPQLPVTNYPPKVDQPLAGQLPRSDTDRDGLIDEEEKQKGTDPTLADSDGDGLTDYDEAVVFGTNPLNPDTDGDSYKDGDEVRNGYNPKGAGKLLDLEGALRQK